MVLTVITSVKTFRRIFANVLKVKPIAAFPRQLSFVCSCRWVFSRSSAVLNMYMRCGSWLLPFLTRTFYTRPQDSSLNLSIAILPSSRIVSSFAQGFLVVSDFLAFRFERIPKQYPLHSFFFFNLTLHYEYYVYL